MTGKNGMEEPAVKKDLSAAYAYIDEIREETPFLSLPHRYLQKSCAHGKIFVREVRKVLCVGRKRRASCWGIAVSFTFP